jgi:hypothetical protein
MENYIVDKSRDHIADEIVESAIFYQLSAIANMVKGVRYKRYDDDEDDVSRIVNYFGVILAPSGRGKDFTMDKAESIFSNILSNYRKNIKAEFNKQLAKIAEYTEIDIANQNYLLPSGFRTSIDGTPEGFQKLMQGMSILPTFSVNIFHGELSDILLNADMLSRIKEAWTKGTAKGKTTASGGYFDVEGVPVNVSLHGAPYGILNVQNKLDKLKEEIIQGFGRRSFFYMQNTDKIVKNSKYKTMSGSNKNELFQLSEMFFDLSKKGRKIKISEEASLVLSNYISNLIDEYNDGDLHNQIKQTIIGSETKIERLACIIAMADFSETVYPEHMEYAIDFANRTNTCMEQIVKGYPIHIDIFNRISISPKGRPDLIQEIRGLSNIKMFNDYMGLTKEYAISQGCIVIEEGDALKVYRAEPLPLTNLNKMIISICATKLNNIEQSIDFKPMRIPFLGDGHSVESLVKSNVGCFTLAHFEPSDNAPHGHRRAESFISGQNMIAIDIDSGLPLSTAKVLLKDYLCLIYTTKSHQKEGKGDRYRIVIPTNKEYFVTSEQHKEMMDNVAKILGVEIYDRQTRNVSRLWYTNESGEVWVNKTNKLFDITKCIPSMDTSKKLMNKIEDVEVLNLEDRVAGIYRWFFLTTSEGNRNDSCFRISKMMRDLGMSNEDIEQHLTSMNLMLDSPLPDSEIRTILRSALK